MRSGDLKACQKRCSGVTEMEGCEGSLAGCRRVIGADIWLRGGVDCRVLGVLANFFLW